ncbi:MAG: hypothetical protein ACXWNK_13365 [Vulcanimicrobiaceae bacterium]
MRKVVAVITFAFLAGCGAHARMNAGFLVHADPGVAGEPNALRISDPAVSSQTLRADLSMTDMFMPPLRLTLYRDGRGEYLADGVRFSMSGSWTATVHEGSRTRSVMLSISSQ